MFQFFSFQNRKNIWISSLVKALLFLNENMKPVVLYAFVCLHYMEILSISIYYIDSIYHNTRFNVAELDLRFEIILPITSARKKIIQIILRRSNKKIKYKNVFTTNIIRHVHNRGKNILLTTPVQK